MKVKQLQEILYKAVPREVEWSKGEAYGFYNIDSENLEVNRILYCVTPSQKVVEYAKENGYDLLISHHPYKMNGIPQAIFHTALDCCDGGLNDQWRDMLDVKNAEHFDGTLGWHGEIEPITPKGLQEKIESYLGTKIIGGIHTDGDLIRSVVICTGLGGLVTELANQTNADCYILGEAVSPLDRMGFNSVIEVGHTLSEQMGVKLFQKLLPELVVDLCPIELDVFGREFYHSRNNHSEVAYFSEEEEY